MNTPMKPQDLSDFTRLFIIEKLTRELLLKSEPHTRRYNQLKGMLMKTINTAEAYEGILPDNYVDKCADLLITVETAIKETT